MKGKVLAKDLRKCKKLADKKKETICLYSVSKEVVEFVSTNSYILFMRRHDIKNNFVGQKIPFKITDELIKKIETKSELVSIEIDNGSLCFNFSDDKIQITIEDTKYVDYQSILISKKDLQFWNKFTFDVKSFKNALNILSAMPKSNNNGCMIYSVDDTLVFSVDDDNNNKTSFVIKAQKNIVSKKNAINNFSLSMESLNFIANNSIGNINLYCKSMIDIFLFEDQNTSIVTMPYEYDEPKKINMGLEFIQINSKIIEESLNLLEGFTEKEDNGFRIQTSIRFHSIDNKLYLSAIGKNLYKAASISVGSVKNEVDFLIDFKVIKKVFSKIEDEHLKLFKSNNTLIITFENCKIEINVNQTSVYEVITEDNKPKKYYDIPSDFVSNIKEIISLGDKDIYFKTIDKKLQVLRPGIGISLKSEFDMNIEENINIQMKGNIEFHQFYVRLLSDVLEKGNVKKIGFCDKYVVLKNDTSEFYIDCGDVNVSFSPYKFKDFFEFTDDYYTDSSIISLDYKQLMEVVKNKNNQVLYSEKEYYEKINSVLFTSKNGNLFIGNFDTKQQIEFDKIVNIRVSSFEKINLTDISNIECLFIYKVREYVGGWNKDTHIKEGRGLFMIKSANKTYYLY